MANLRRNSGGSGRSDLDYYEYKRQHDLRRTRQSAPQATVSAKEAPPQPAAVQPELDRTGVENQEFLKEEERPQSRMGGLLGGMKSLVRGVHRHVPDEPEDLEDIDVPNDAIESEEIPAVPESHIPFMPPRAASTEPAPLESEPEALDIDLEDAAEVTIGAPAIAPVDPEPIIKDDEAEEQDAGDEDDAGEEDEESAAQIDHPFAGVADKARFLLGKMRQLTSARSAQAPAASEPHEEEPEKTFADDAGDAVLPSEPSVKPARSRFAWLEQEEDDDDDYDDLRPAGGLKLFGFGFNRSESSDRKSQAEEFDAAQQEDLDMDDKQQPVSPELTRMLSEASEAPRALSRRERRALAGASQPEPHEDPAPEPARSRQAAQPVPSESETVSEPDPIPQQQPSVLVDEPTQEFKPLRVRVLRPSQPEEPVAKADEEDEEEVDLPRRAARSAKKAEKKAKKEARRSKRRVYLDEDLDEDDYDEYDDYDDDYDDDEYDDYDDEYDRYDDDYDDDYDDEYAYEEEARYDREYHVSIGRRILGFFKTLLVILLLLAVCVLVLRQLESSDKLSLDGLRSTVGQVIPLEGLFPDPEMDPLPQESAQPEVTPAGMIVPQASATVQPYDTAAVQNDVTPQPDAAVSASDAAAPQPSAVPVAEDGATAAPQA